MLKCFHPRKQPSSTLDGLDGASFFDASFFGLFGPFRYFIKLLIFYCFLFDILALLQNYLNASMSPLACKPIDRKSLSGAVTMLTLSILGGK